MLVLYSTKNHYCIIKTTKGCVQNELRKAQSPSIHQDLNIYAFMLTDEQLNNVTYENVGNICLVHGINLKSLS